MNTFTCSRCGLPNPPNSNACARCGLPLGAAAGGPGDAWAPPPQQQPYFAPPPPKGRSTGAIIGIVVAVIAVGIFLVGIVAAIAIPSLIRARGAANESAAIGMLRSISSAEKAYFVRNQRYATLAELGRGDLIDPPISNGGERYSYVFREVKVSESGFEISAEPSVERQVTAGDRSYNVTQDLVIRYKDGPKAPVGTSGVPLG